jgi:hypothetical protein
MRPEFLQHENHQEVRDFAAWQNTSSDTFLAAEDAKQGMAGMGAQFRGKGSEIYLPVVK